MRACGLHQYRQKRRWPRLLDSGGRIMPRWSRLSGVSKNRKAVTGSPSWIRIELSAALRSQPLGRFWKVSESCVSPPRGWRDPRAAHDQDLVRAVHAVRTC